MRSHGPDTDTHPDTYMHTCTFSNSDIGNEITYKVRVGTLNVSV